MSLEVTEKDLSVGGMPTAICERTRGLQGTWQPASSAHPKAALEQGGLERHGSHAVSNGPVRRSGVTRGGRSMCALGRLRLYVGFRLRRRPAPWPRIAQGLAHCLPLRFFSGEGIFFNR